MIIRIKRLSGNITMFKGDIGCKHLVFVIEFSLDLYLFITWCYEEIIIFLIFEKYNC